MMMMLVSETVQGVRLRRYVLQETTDNRVSFCFRSPREGVYYLTVYAQRVRAGRFINQ